MTMPSGIHTPSQSTEICIKNMMFTSNWNSTWSDRDGIFLRTQGRSSTHIEQWPQKAELRCHTFTQKLYSNFFKKMQELVFC